MRTKMVQAGQATMAGQVRCQQKGPVMRLLDVKTRPPSSSVQRTIRLGLTEERHALQVFVESVD